MLKIDKDILSDDQIKILRDILKQYKKDKKLNIQRIQEIEEALKDREDPIRSRIYKVDQE